jgi:Domain of unknown function (DUF4168)
MRLTANTRSALLASGLLALLPTALLAQSADPSTPPEATTPDPMAPGATPETQTPVVEDRKVDQFAAAFVAVQDIQAKATQELSTAKDEQQATQVKASAEQKMIEAVQREGLEVEEFNRIADLMTTDLTLRSKVVEKVEKRRKG